MKSLKDFLSQFLENKGQHVFFSLLTAKICAFAGSLFLIRLLPETEFGTLSVVASLFALFLPFSGMGSQQILLRYGSISEAPLQKKALSAFLFRSGLIQQVALSLLFIGLSFIYAKKYEDIFVIFGFFAVRLLGYYFFNHLQSKFRIFGDNRKFAFVTNVVNISGLVLLLVLTYFYGMLGYLIAIAITPFIALIWMDAADLWSLPKRLDFNLNELRSYGLHAAGTALISDALFSADVLLLSFLMNESAVANYKVAILIPANITFLAVTFMQSDFPTLARNYRNKTFLLQYVRNYYKIFIPVTVFIFLGGLFLKEEILTLFFGSRYVENTAAFLILLAAFCLNMLFRNLYGNLLSAVGLMKKNTVISLLTLLISVAGAALLIKQWGVVGMAAALGGSMFFGGLLLLFSFYHYWKKLK